MPTGPKKSPPKRIRRPAGKFSGPAYAEAEQRIAEAVATNATKLDLSIGGLTRIPPLTGLTALHSLNLIGAQVIDIAPLTCLTALQSLNLVGTEVSDLSPLSGLTFLQALDLGATQVTDISPLAGLIALQSLDLDDTEVSDITPLSNLTALQSLSFRWTLVADLSPLTSHTKLQTLILSDTRVSDLSPLAGLTSLIDGAKSELRSGLSVLNCPLRDKSLQSFASLKNPERTIKIINHLRQQQGLEPYDPTARKDVAALSTEELSKLLEQDDTGTRVIAAGDQLALAASGTKSDIEAAQSPVAQQLHRTLIPKARSLTEYAARLQNQPGWRELQDTAKALQQLVERPLVEVAERVAEFWSLSGAMGAFLIQDDNADRPDSLITRLEPDGRRHLSEVVTLSATLTRQFPTAIKLDNELREALHAPPPVEAAKATIEAAQKSQVLRQVNVTILSVAINAPLQDNPQSRKAHNRSARTIRNVVFAALFAGAGILAAGYLGEIGTEIAHQSILAKRIEDFILNGEKAIFKLLEGEPADKQAAAREMVRRIKQGSQQTPPKTEPPQSKH